jgi:hypothetical protein
MTPYAEAADIEARIGRNLTDAERAKAEALIGDATVRIASEAGIADPAPTEMQDLLKGICCAMVLRAFNAPAFGVSSVQQMAGSYSESLSYSNPSGDLYMTSSERKLLGIGRQRIGAVRPEVRPMAEAGI